VLQGMYPGIRDHHVDGRRAYVYGAEMTPGITPEAAAEEFLTSHGQIFGVGSLEWEPLRRQTSRDGRLVIFAYQQKIREKAVHGGQVRVVVRTGAVPRVCFAGVRLAGEPSLGLETPIISSELVPLVVQTQPGFNDFVPAGEAELVALRGGRSRQDAWCWRIRMTHRQRPLDSRTFFLNTGTAEIVHIRDSKLHASPPTSGTLDAKGTSASALSPYIPGVTGVLDVPMPQARITGIVNTTTHVFTDDAGAFVVELGDEADPIALLGSIGPDSTLRGRWFRLRNLDGNPYSNNPPSVPQLDAPHTSVVGSSGNALSLSSTSSLAYRVAQSDVWVSAHRARAFADEFIGSILGSSIMHLWVNVQGGSFPFDGDCNAMIDPALRFVLFTTDGTVSSIGDCWNMGSHSVVTHEIGHQVHWDFGVQDGEAFMEGYADCFAIFTNDDVVQGRWLWDTSSGPMHVRDDPTSSNINCQYPISTSSPALCQCTAGPHNGGQLLSGPWVRILRGFRDEYGEDVGLDKARELFGAWSNVMLGINDNCNGANEDVLIEILGVAGSDGMTIVCPAFYAHSIDTPVCN
jgi:hypothetical protein